MLKLLPKMHRKTPLLRVLFLLVIAAGLSGCYMPIRFDAEIELSRRGYYEFFFDGYLAKVALYEGLRKKEVTPEDEAKQAKDIETDFRRDTSTKKFKYYKQGHFHVNWQRKGDLIKTKSVTFVRRNEQMLSMSYNSNTGRVQVSGRSIKRDTKRQLAEMGLDMTGEIRVITDTNVVSHNATSVKKLKTRPKFKMYTWKIKSIFDRTPSLITTLR